MIGTDLQTQIEAALHNLETVLGQAGAGLGDVVTWTVLIVEGQPLPQAFAAFQHLWGDRGPAPAITVAIVSGLANPRFLCEISATAVLAAE